MQLLTGHAPDLVYYRIGSLLGSVGVAAGLLLAQAIGSWRDGQEPHFFSWMTATPEPKAQPDTYPDPSRPAA